MPVAVCGCMVFRHSPILCIKSCSVLLRGLLARTRRGCGPVFVKNLKLYRYSFLYRVQGWGWGENEHIMLRDKT